MNFTERLAQEIARAASMTLPELEQALEAGQERTIGELTALSLAKKAAEGGMDAVKLIRELSKGEPQQSDFPGVEIRVLRETDDE